MNATAAVRVRCSKCAAPIRWTAGEPALACEFCGGTETVPVPDTEIVEHDIALAMNRRDHLGYPLPVRRLKCGQCHAVVALEPGVTAGSCAFCGSAAVADVADNGRHYRPESLIPFAIGRERAVELFREWVKQVSFAPSDLKRKAEVADLVGVYLPYWVYDAQASSKWRARVGFVEMGWLDEENQKHWDEKTRWEDASGEHQASYDEVIVDASKGMPQKLLAGIEPFDTSKLVPWDARYIAGFASEEYAIDAMHGWFHAGKEMRRREREACEKLLPGDKHKSFVVDTQFADVRFKHVLLPIWIANYTYKDRRFQFLINGQTGKVHGDAPESWVFSVLATAFVLVLVGIAIWLFE